MNKILGAILILAIISTGMFLVVALPHYIVDIPTSGVGATGGIATLDLNDQPLSSIDWGIVQNNVPVTRSVVIKNLESTQLSVVITNNLDSALGVCTNDLVDPIAPGGQVTVQFTLTMLTLGNGQGFNFNIELDAS